MKTVYIPLAQVIRQRDFKKSAFNDSLGFKSRRRTLDECNHFKSGQAGNKGEARINLL